MKKILFTAFTVVTGFVLSQQENTLPAEGNVGLGTLNPSAKLDVNGNVHIDSTLKVKKGLTAEEEVRFTHLEPVSEGEQDFMLIRPDGKIFKGNAEFMAGRIGELIYTEKECGSTAPTWYNSANKIFSACPDVYVGIATNEPRFSLDVRGTSYSRKLALGDVNTSQVPSAFYLRSPLNKQASEKLFIIENSERKIFQLDNNGLLQAREIKLDTQDWPDYVFEPGYVLPSLREVELHIESYGHLPKVPAADSIEQAGLNVAEMDKILMEKVEEITLYLIELNKQIERQGRQIAAIEDTLQK
ncbi:MAG: hypothetical protein K0R65_1152 [Crocinitomicaceae bacterium]|jgi:hypothetical protein|nr:hypothetical protein [Crocinitomicaceae bacterium]